MLENNRKWLILFATGIMIMLVNLDMTIVNLALADISYSLNATLNQTQWIITSYLLATALSFTIFGRLADLWGRKRIFLFGVFLFTIGSLGAGFATDIPFLMIMRFIQGLGFAAALGLSMVIIFTHFPASQRGLAAGVAVTITGISQAIGPTAGGLIVQHFNWSWVFWINVPLGLISLLFTSIVTPTDRPDSMNKRINLTNVGLFVTGLGLILYTVNQWEQWSYLNLFSCFLGGILLLYLFVRSCHKMSHPLVNIDLLTHKGFRLLVTLRFLFMTFMSSFLFIIPLYLQNILSYSPSNAGFIMLGMTLFVAISSIFVGKVMDKIGFVYPVFVSVILAFLASLVTFFFTASQNLIPIFLCLFILGLAIGIHTPSTINGVNKEAAEKDAGTAMGLFFTMAISGAVVGVALAGTILGALSKKLLLVKVGASAITSTLLYAASGTRSLTELPLNLQEIAKDSFMYAFHGFMSVISVLMFLAILLAIYFVRYHVKQRMVSIITF